MEMRVRGLAARALDEDDAISAVHPWRAPRDTEGFVLSDIRNVASIGSRTDAESVDLPGLSSVNDQPSN